MERRTIHRYIHSSPFDQHGARSGSPQLFHHKVGTGVSSTISTRLVAGRTPSRRIAKNVDPTSHSFRVVTPVKICFLLGTMPSPERI